MDTSGLSSERLTRRENDILALLGQNLTNHEIAARLVLSLNSVKWYARKVYAKLGVTNRQEAVAKARELGLLSRETPAKKPAHNLPRQLSSFIGREKEIDRVVKMVWEYPLVTLTGAGGVGKTRLAQAAARELLDDFSDGVYYVEFAALAEPQLVARTLADVLDIHIGPGQSIIDAIFLHFYDHQTLLVLDNCEHLIRACADLANELLTHLPRLKIIATSREPLGVNGEAVFRVPSLTFPEIIQVQGVEETLAFEAVRLYVERARTILPDFQLTPANVAPVVQICQRLDGIPLAIELAAARTRNLSVEQIAAHLEHAFGLLTGGSRTELPRHQTLKALIDWSYNLLSVEERNLLLRLSVFAGGWTVEATEAVCADPLGDPGPIRFQAEQIVDLLAELVDKSLIQFEPSTGDEPRYHMLETVHQYTLQRMMEEGEEEKLLDRHLAYFIRLTEQALPTNSNGIMSPSWQQRIANELDNFRLALKWAQKTNIEAGLRMCVTLFEAYPPQYKYELVTTLEQFLAIDAEDMAKPGKQPRSKERNYARGYALCVVSGWRFSFGDRDLAEKALWESNTILKDLGELQSTFLTGNFINLGLQCLVSDPEQSLIYLEKSLDSARKQGDERLIPYCYTVMANSYACKGDLVQAIRCGEESLALSRTLGILDEEVVVLGHMAWIERMQGNNDRAIEDLRQCQNLYSKMNDFENLASWMTEQAAIDLSEGNYDQVIRVCEKMTDFGQELGDNSFLLYAEEFKAWIEWAKGAYDQASQRIKKALAAYNQNRDAWPVGLVYVLGRLALSLGELGRAEGYFRQMDAMIDAPIWPWKAYSLHAFGLLAAARARQRSEQADRAAILFAVQDKQFRWLPNYLSPSERKEYEQALAAVKEALGTEGFTAGWARGQAMTRQQAFAYALAEADEKI